MSASSRPSSTIRTPTVYQKHYNQASGLEASHRYQRLLDDLLESADESDELEE